MALNNDLRTLASFAAFREIEGEALKLIALSAETRILRVGEVLFRKGEPADGAMIMLSGTASLEGAGPPVVVRPPTLLGETALVVETRRPVTATTREPASVLRIPRTLYLRVLAEYPHSARRVHRLVHARVSALNDEYEAVRRNLTGELGRLSADGASQAVDLTT